MHTPVVVHWPSLTPRLPVHYVLRPVQSVMNFSCFILLHPDLGAAFAHYPAHPSLSAACAKKFLTYPDFNAACAHSGIPTLPFHFMLLL
eukprot:1145059-Pelagomonas_calceolata.AAC.3